MENPGNNSQKNASEMQLTALSQIPARTPLLKRFHQMHLLANQVLPPLLHESLFHIQHRVNYIHHLEKMEFARALMEREHLVPSTNQVHEPEKVDD